MTKLGFGLLVTSAFLTLFAQGCKKYKLAYAPPPKPIYNAVFSSTVAHTYNGLLDKKPIDVSFFIGPPHPRNAVPPFQQPVNPAIAENLYVTLYCLFCANSSMQKQAIKYDKEHLSSTKATFPILPSRELVRSDDGKSDIVFQVSGVSDGILYDNVVVPVTVELTGESENTSNVNAIEREAEAPLTQSASSRSIDLTISCREESGTIVLQLVAANPELNKRLGGRNLESDGKTPIKFKTAISSGQLADTIAADYGTLASVLTNRPDLLRALNGDPGQKIQLGGQKTVMNDADEAALLSVFFEKGKDLYSKLFIEGDQTLSRLSKTIDQYRPAYPPLRVRIESQIPFIPWQYLHPVQAAVDPKLFWGFRYELIVDPGGWQADSPYGGTSSVSGGTVIFVKYRSDDSDSQADKDIATLGDNQYELVKTLIPTAVDKTDSLINFKNSIAHGLNDMEMIIAFTHGENGGKLTVDKDGDYIVEFLASGPKLRFAKNEFVSAREFAGYPSLLNMSPLRFDRQPLVLLNGCETSGVGFFATQFWSFPSIFLKFGARGVVATEAPIWPTFGFYFSKTLLTRIGLGTPAPAALLESRKEWLNDNHNPLGLLYSYYGGADAALSFH